VDLDFVAVPACAQGLSLLLYEFDRDLVDLDELHVVP